MRKAPEGAQYQLDAQRAYIEKTAEPFWFAPAELIVYGRLLGRGEKPCVVGSWRQFSQTQLGRRNLQPGNGAATGRGRMD